MFLWMIIDETLSFKSTLWLKEGAAKALGLETYEDKEFVITQFTSSGSCIKEKSSAYPTMCYIEFIQSPHKVCRYLTEADVREYFYIEN